MCRKSIIVLLLIVNTIFAFTGCSYVAYKEYYSDINDYTEIWNLTGFHHGYETDSRFFPKSIDDLNVKDFICRYDQQLPLGEGVQVFLEIQYIEKESFNMELERIVSMSFDCDDYFEDSTLSAYATRLGSDYSSEYALINEEQQIIYYIYLQNIPKDEIEFDYRFLPIEYSGFGEMIQESN